MLKKFINWITGKDLEYIILTPQEMEMMKEGLPEADFLELEKSQKKISKRR